MVNPIGIVLAGKKVGQALLKKFKPKKVADTITSVAPNVPKTGIEKATRTLKISTQKMKAQMAKMESDVFHGTQKIVKALDKMKKPKGKN